MTTPKQGGNAIELFIPGVFAIGTYDFGPWQLGNFSGILLDMTRSAAGASTNGTCTVSLMVNDPTLGLLAQLDGAGAAVAINDWAANELVRRQLQVHPIAGPIPSSDADGVFTVGAAGVASTYYRQPVQDPFTLRMVIATDTSTFTGAVLHFLH